MAVKTFEQLKQDLVLLIRSGNADTSALDVRTMFINTLDTVAAKLSPIKKIFLNNQLQTPDADGNLNLIVAVDTSNLATKQELSDGLAAKATPADVAAAKDSIVAGSPDDTLLKLYNKIVALQALINGDDVNLDSIKEISDYIKANKTLIDSITTDKVSTAAIYNALDLTTSGKVLDARQGKVLKDLIDNLQQQMNAVGTGGGTTEVAFAAALKFDKSYKTTRNAAAADTLTVNVTGALYHNRHTIYYTAGSVKPTFSGANWDKRWDNWDQAAAGGNILTCVYLPNGKAQWTLESYG